jgi:acetyl esterase/lipase
MPTRFRFLPFLYLLLLVSIVSADEQEIDLWPTDNFTADDREAETVEDSGKDGKPDRRVANVRVPTLKFHLPASPEENCAAVIICPGGGYAIEAIDKEGYEPARWFQERGIVGIVLKYRLPQGTDGDESPSEDVSRAIRFVRQRASEWNIDPARIGIMGFSAGGHLASTSATHFDSGDSKSGDPIERVSSRPDFQILIYPVITMDTEVGHSGSRERLLGKSPTAEALAYASNDLQVTDKSPPAFLIHTSDDRVSCENSLRYASALKRNNIPLELHLYERGGHGYGMRGGNGPVDAWPKRLEEWLELRGIMKKAR